MAQLGIRVDAAWFEQMAEQRQLSLQIYQRSFETSAGCCLYQLADCELYVWGDCAMRGQDAVIIQGLIAQRPVSVFGRSWMAVQHRSGKVLGATDQLGLFPILLLPQQQDWFICSDRQVLHQLLGSLPALSASAMQQMLCFGQILDGSSIIAGAYHLSASRLFELEQGKLNLTELPRRRPLCESTSATFDQALEAFVEAVRQSLHYAVNPIVSLSGGLDSRLILAACMTLGKKVPTLCYGDHRSDDVRIARQLAHQAGYPMFYGQQVHQVQNWQISRRISLIGLGEVPLHHAHALIDDDLLAQTRDSTLLTGTGAEAYRAFYYDRGMPGFELFDQPWLQQLCLPRIQRYIREEFFRVARPIFSIVPQLETQLSPMFEATLANTLRKEVDCTRAADQFYLDVRVSRMVVAGQQLLDPFYQRSHPFLAPDVLSTVGSLPARYKVGSYFHRKAICKLAPKLAEIPWDKTGLPLHLGLPVTARYPGMMQLFGKPAFYGKRSVPMFDYQSGTRMPYEHVLDVVLAYIGIQDEKQRQHQIWELLRSKALPHIQGLADVWSHLLAARPAAVRGE